MSIRQDLQDYISDNGLSQSAVARAVGVTSPVVNQYLHGKYPGNVQEIERKIAAYLQKQREREAAYSDAEYGAFKGVSDKVGSGMDALGRWAKQNPDQAQVATGAGWMAAAAAAARGVFSFMPGGSLLGFGGGSAAGGGGAAGGTAGGLATGSLAMASLPLIGFGGATYLAGRRDKYGEWSEGLQGFGRWLDKYLPSFRGDSKGEWLKSRIGQSPDAAQAYQDYLRGQGHTPLDSPELRMSAEQLQEAAQRMENSGEQYAQAVSDNQQAAAQFLEASRLMGTAAGQLAAAARQPVPVTVSVSGGNITAAVSQAAERDNRRN